MLKKRTRSQQKGQQNMGQLHHEILDSHEFCNANSNVFLDQKQKNCSFFAVPGLFIGLNPKNPESDSIESPTSPLDFKIFSKPKGANLPLRSNEESQKSWHCSKVGLSIIESLENDTKTSSGKVIRSFDSKSIVFAPQMRILNNPCLKSTHIDHFESTSNSLPKSYPNFPHTHIKKPNPHVINSLKQDPFAKTLSCSLESTNLSSNLRSNLSSSNLRLSKEIELSEDYTCIRKHGLNPKTTHIFGDCILECDDDNFVTKSIEYEEQQTSYSFDDFLSHCYTCKKMLDGEDIYMYRGEKAFCSLNCRSQEILIEEEKEKTNTKLELKPNDCDELFETSMFIAA